MLMLLGAAPVNGNQTVNTNPTIELTPAEKGWITAHKHIKVGIDPSFPPLKFSDNGTIKGLELDYLKLLSERIGLQFEPVVAGFTVLDEMVKSGEVDMFISFNIPERLAYMQFTDPLIEFKQIIISRQDAPFLSGLSSLKGKKVATVRGVKLYDKLLRPYPEIQVVQFSSMDQMFRAVSEHKADVLISRTLYAGHIINNYPDLKVAGVIDLPAEPYRYAVRKEYPELVTILNKAISTISRDQHDLLAQKWFNITIDYRARWSDIPIWVYLLGGVVILFSTVIIVSNRRLKREMAERNRAEQASADSAKQLNAIINTTDAGIILVSPLGVIEFANNRMADMFTLPLNDLIGTRYVERLHPSERQIGDERMRQLIKGEIRSVTLDRHYIRADGTDFWGHLSGSRMEHADGSLKSLVGVISDITHRKQAEDTLREMEATAQAAKRHLEEAQRIAHLGSWQLNIVSNQLVWSKECYAIFGIQQDTSLTFESFVNCIHPDDRDLVSTAWSSALTGAPYDITHRICVGDKVKWVVEQADIVFDNNGNALHGVGTVQDITERKETDNALREAKERFQFVIEGSQLGFWDWDIATGSVIRNERWAEMLGYTVQDIENSVRQWIDYIHPDDRDPAMQSLQDHLDGKTEMHKAEYRMLTKAGQYRWILDQAKIVSRDSHGKPLRMCGTHTDITERKQILNALQESEERYRNLVDNLQNVVVYQITGDLEGNRKFAYISRAVERLNEITVEEVLTDANVIYRQILPQYHDELQLKEVEAISNHAPLHIEVQSLLPSGIVKWFEFTVSPRIRHDGQIIWDGVEVDITHRKQSEQELIEAKLSADAANLAKSEFLANMSHEIRTPMNGVVGMTHLLRTTDLTPEQEQYLANIEISANSLTTLISDILDLSKIESGKMVLESTAFSLRSCIQDILSSQQFFIQQKAIRVTTEIADELPNTLIGDQLRTRQILLNILGNAIKFTEQGQINIVAELVEQHDRDIHVRMAIRDTGIGMSEQLQEQIFAPFVQADSSTTRRYGGSGLGLAICRRLADLMGGRIWVESREGAGSCFYIELHFTDAGTINVSPPVAVAETSLLGRSLTILLAEDNRVNAEFIDKILSRLGHRVICVENGRQALEMLTRQNFDCILMDIQMPILGGDAATVIIREQEIQTGGHIPIIALTAHAMHEERLRILAQGFDAHIAKPVDISQLISELYRITSLECSGV